MTISTEQFLSVNTGISANDGTGDSLRAAFIKVNENFDNMSTIGFDAGNINVGGAVQAVGNISATGFTGGNILLSGNIGVASVLSTNLFGTIRTAAQTSITSVGTLTALTVNTTSATISLAASGTTGQFILGGVSQTGTIGIGRSTATHTINIGNGAVTSGNVKTINLGTGGVSGSVTNILIGPTNSGSQGNINLQSNVLLNGTYIPSSASASGFPGQIIWDADFIYICVAANTWKRANVSTW